MIILLNNSIIQINSENGVNIIILTLIINNVNIKILITFQIDRDI